jgi:hypothetical protein
MECVLLPSKHVQSQSDQHHQQRGHQQHQSNASTRSPQTRTDQRLTARFQNAEKETAQSNHGHDECTGTEKAFRKPKKKKVSITATLFCNKRLVGRTFGGKRIHENRIHDFKKQPVTSKTADMIVVDVDIVLLNMVYVDQRIIKERKKEKRN